MSNESLEQQVAALVTKSKKMLKMGGGAFSISICF